MVARVQWFTHCASCRVKFSEPRRCAYCGRECRRRGAVESRRQIAAADAWLDELVRAECEPAYVRAQRREVARG